MELMPKEKDLSSQRKQRNHLFPKLQFLNVSLLCGSNVRLHIWESPRLMYRILLVAMKTQRNFTANSKASQTPFYKKDIIVVMGEFNAVVGVNSVGNEDIMGNLDMTPEIKEMGAFSNTNGTTS